MKGAKIIGGNGERIDSDFYPTPIDVTIALMDFLKAMGYLRSISGNLTTALEPCCGEGAISKIMMDYGLIVESHDLRCTEFAGEGIDYFSKPHKTVDVIITNPPFSLAEKFIQKALCEANLVAMLLKTQYWHASKRAKIFKEWPPAYILPLTWRPNFFGDKATGSPTMDFIWTVWLTGKSDTRYRLLPKPTKNNLLQIAMNY